MAETSRRLPSTPTPSDEQRVMLIAALMAWGMVAAVMGIRLGAWLLAPSAVPSYIPEQRLIQAFDDAPLLDRSARAEAIRTGVAVYDFDGIHYVDASLSDIYWTSWTHE